ncbi:LysR family transcriptional regulator [Bacillus sp. BRMEA1]|uniref:LysR family transcriptional regulator n=1 Tax=Neobacillus endophyticus TaxID=2738405 RepID=UPI0015634E0B|nr:LysR family transcriptional regulator [Neobacillus endophyticus]NRD80894.1 LysR family transcriptional regulator [Neobacillus endophyticus]
MDIKQLRYFIATAKYLNMTVAAKNLYIAQPALSRQIIDLEGYLGVTLFIRDKRGLKLTRAGMELLSAAKEIVAKSDEAIERVKLAGAGLKGDLKIGYVGTSDKIFLPKLLRTFRKKHPDVGLSLEYANSEALNDALNSGELDVVFTFTVGIENITDLSWEKIYTESFALIVSEDHPLAKEKKVQITDLSNELFILLSRTEAPQLFDYILKLCASGGFYPKNVSHPHFDTVLLQVEANLGITVLSRHGKAFASPSLRFIDIEHTVENIDLVMAWKTNNTNPCIPLFLIELQELLKASNFEEVLSFGKNV